MRSGQKHKIIATVLFSCWLICIRYLYPIPQSLEEERLLLWLIYLLIVFSGLLTSHLMTRGLSKARFLLSLIPIVFYFLLRVFGFDEPLYVGLWRRFTGVSGYEKLPIDLILGGWPFGILRSVIFGFAIPAILISCSFLLALELRLRGEAALQHQSVL